MGKRVSVTLPDAVYEYALLVAEADQRSIADVLLDSMVQTPPIFSVDPERTEMLREQAAYASMHADLLANYEGQFIAIHLGDVLDHDFDEQALSQRVRQRYPGSVILVRQVLPQAERVLHLRSPRFVRVE